MIGPVPILAQTMPAPEIAAPPAIASPLTTAPAPQLASSISASSRLNTLLAELPTSLDALQPAPVAAEPVTPGPAVGTSRGLTPTATALAPYADLGPTVVLLAGALGGLMALARRRFA